jgi:hypothetical protein
VTLKDRVRGRVRFAYYRDAQLFYETDDHFLFPVPTSDIGNATFLAEDKAILFMRYIRRHMEAIKNEGA